MARTPSFRSIRFALVALFAAGGLLVWGELAPIDGYVSFRVPASLPGTSGLMRRDQLHSMSVVVRDKEGLIVAHAEQDMADGLVGPVTAPISMRLPRGEYVVLATFAGDPVGTATLIGSLELSEDGYHRVVLQRPR